MASATAFTFGRKGLTAAVPLESGGLLISGYLTRWKEIDRDGEYFVRESVTPHAIKAFLSRHAPLVYNHSLKDVIGRVLELEPDDVGLRIKARLARPDALPNNLRWIREAVKDKLIGGLSMGAVFTRSGNQIVNADLVEASITASPKLTSTSFDVLGHDQKAFSCWMESRAEKVERARRDLAQLQLKLAAAEIAHVARGRF